ncbi:MAG: kynureninase [bacterium]
MSITRSDCIALDREDLLGEYRDRFVAPENTIYLDGNSLGVLPCATLPSLTRTVELEWGQDLIQSWNKAGWFELPSTLGNRIGTLIGADSGQVVVSDNTSINLFKAINAVLGINLSRHRLLAHKGEFPTDLYIIQSAAASCGREVSVELYENEQDIAGYFNQDVAVAVLSQVNYKTGAILNMERINRAARDQGILVIWDLCHSAGILPVELDLHQADFAVGCTYKYLNGGPGSPAFVYAATRHHHHMTQPLSGWWSHADPFAFSHQYTPSVGIKRMLSGTQSVLSMRGVECGLDTFADISIHDIRGKSMSLCGLFIQLVEQECAGFGLNIAGPDVVDERGSHVSIAFEHGYSVVQAMIDRGVVGDFRAPDLMRFGFAPLYISFTQIWDAVAVLNQCLLDKAWLDPKYNRVATVT